MATNREIQETIARCVSIMVFYHNMGKTTHTKALMAAEIGVVAQSVKESMSQDDTWRRVLESVNVELIARYGPELGVRLDGEFYKAFEAAMGRMPVGSFS